MRAVIFGFNRFLVTIVGVKGREADFAAKLRTYFTVVVIQELMRGFAERALFSLRDGFPRLEFNRFKWPAMLGLMSLKQYFVV